MLARGIRSYHRPTRLEEALSLARQGVVPLAGGTRLFATDREVPNVLDLSALGLGRIEMVDGDLRIGTMVALQDVIDSPLAHTATAGLLPAAARAHSASPSPACASVPPAFQRRRRAWKAAPETRPPCSDAWTRSRPAPSSATTRTRRPAIGRK